MKKENKRKAREAVLKALFEGEFHEQHVNYENSPWSRLEPNVKKYSMQLWEGVKKEKIQIDELIEKTSESWKLDRMPLIDLNIMRISIYEMLYLSERIPFKVSINEALEMAKLYGTLDSPTFINGILDSVSKQKTKISTSKIL